ncbi:MAG: hypothetical protein OXF68_15290 [Gammaproteobacteria bacterium]|nr:hypothetical protein [Gammaproteobacteria bacterium]
MAQHGKAQVTLGHWAAAAMAKATGSALSDRAADALTDRALSGLAVILHVDEAHSLPHKALDTLKDLHIAGIEAGSPLPCLVLLTGLQRTLTHITARPGLTRCADGATYHLMPLTEPECKASTARMLADLLTESAPVRQTDSIAAASGPWSFGHPRHLLTVQQAICSELLRVNGQASKMDARRIEADTAERRFAYYSRRVNEVTAGPRRTQAVLRTLIELAEHPIPADPEAAAALIDQAINSGQTPEIPLSECQSLVSNMAAKGLIENALELWVVAIPSMATWAEERLDSQPSAEVEP